MRLLAAARGPLAPRARPGDRIVPRYNARTLREHIGRALAEERVNAALLSAFGLLALVLAGIGLYGVIAYTTELRSREFGIRLALGASSRTLLGLVVREGADVPARRAAAVEAIRTLRSE